MVLILVLLDASVAFKVERASSNSWISRASEILSLQGPHVFPLSGLHLPVQVAGALRPDTSSSKEFHVTYVKMGI